MVALAADMDFTAAECADEHADAVLDVVVAAVGARLHETWPAHANARILLARGSDGQNWA
jgi:hypothetical protein